MINRVFDACVSLLLYCADRLGISYEAINIWIFVILWPAATLGLVALLVAQHQVIRSLRKRTR
jgi:hypothetical protein